MSDVKLWPSEWSHRCLTYITLCSPLFTDINFHLFSSRGAFTDISSILFSVTCAASTDINFLVFSPSWCIHWAAVVWRCGQQAGRRNRSNDPATVSIISFVSAASNHQETSATNKHWRTCSCRPRKTSQRGTNLNSYTITCRHV